MAEYTLKVRRYQPESGEGPYWEEFNVDLDPSLSVLDGLLQAKDRDDGSLSVRCSCRAAICGSCGMKINGQSGLGCKTQIGEAQELADKKASAAGNGDGGDVPIVVEPMGNMPVIKDLITDMESTHWAKIRRVTPWLLPHGEPPEREYVVEPESMIDITQSMACIQCGACVSSCLSMEADPDFIGPAALAKAYRFVGDPRDAETEERLHDLAHDPHGIYDCTHCFSCVDACPKGVAPMDQIMRLRRKAGEEGIDDPNNGHNHETAFVKIIEKKGTLDEALLLQESYAPGVKGKLKPSKRAIKGLIESLPTVLRGDQDRQGALAAEGDPRHPPEASRRRPGRGQGDLQARRGAPRGIQPLHQGRGGRNPSPTRHGALTARRQAERGVMSEQIKLAYWPGCVSRGFTTELHGSMALVAEKLGIELVELDRANCCGAGVIAEHNQELADTLNARTFALAQQTGLSMMNICSTCQGAQSECQQRLDADSSYRAHINEVLSGQGLAYEKGKDGFTNKNFLWLLVEDYGLDRLAEKVKRPLSGLRVGPFYGCYVVRPKERLGYDEYPRPRHLPGEGDRGARRRGRRVRRRPQVLRLPGDHDEPRDLAAPGRHPRRRRARRRRRLPRHPLPPLPPQPRHAAARGGQGRQPRPRPRRPAPAAAGRPGARRGAQAARDEQAHRLDRVGRGAARRGSCLTHSPSAWWAGAPGSADALCAECPATQGHPPFRDDESPRREPEISGLGYSPAT